MDTRGTFIAIEGGDGSGKSTQVALLRERLGRDDILYVADPGSTDVGTKLLDLVRYHTPLTVRAELFLFLASRAQLAEEVILPALQRGTHVISNRYDLSTIAYQVYGRKNEEHAALVLEMNKYARVVEPDLYIFIDVPPEVSRERLQSRGEKPTRFEVEQLAFHERVRRGYHEHLPSRQHTVIDGTKSIDEVYRDVEAAVLRAIQA